MFSELVDKVIAVSRRTDLLIDVVSYMNASIREAHVSAFFARDLVEDQLSVSSSPFIWSPPRNLRTFRTVKYSDGLFPQYMPPGKRQRDLSRFYYMSGTSFVFAGVTQDELIDVAYYQYPQRFNYYLEAARPAKWDNETETWTYLQGSNYVSALATAEQEETARNKVSNWLLQLWPDIAYEGAYAKVLKRNGDERASSSFALFSAYKKDLIRGELCETLRM